MAQIGDIVRFLNSVGGGRIVKIAGNIAHVEDEDGFEVPVLLRECVVVATGPEAAQQTELAKQRQDTFRAPKQPQPSQNTPAPQAAAPRVVPVPEPEPEIEETPGGDILNLVLAYEPQNPQQITTTEFDAYLVNDSNYYLYFTYMVREADKDEWTVRFAGMVEPNIQLLVDTVSREMLPSMERVGVQYIAFKRDKAFQAKTPTLVDLRLDVTKFFKLHCFRANTYFDTNVIALDIVKEDRPNRQQPVDSSRLEKAMKQKIAHDRRPVVKRQLKKADRVNGDLIEVDLHIDELIDNTAGLSPADMLNLQIDEFRRVMDQNLKRHGQRIVFIHGKGEGVLRKALMKELTHRYKGHNVQDASFLEYGYGATQVTIN